MNTGTRIHVATDRAYYGVATTEAVQPDGNLIVKMGSRRGLIAPDQAFLSKSEATAKAQTTIFAR